MENQKIREYLTEAEGLVPDSSVFEISQLLESDARRFERAFSEEEEAKLK